MSDRAQDLAEAAAGHKARQELELTTLGFARLREGMLEQIATSTPTDQAKRERLYFGVQALDAVKAALLRTVDAGTAADTRLALQEYLQDKE